MRFRVGFVFGVTIWVLMGACSAGGCSHRYEPSSTAALSDDVTVERLLQAVTPPSRKGAGQPSQDCLVTFEAIDRYPTETIRAGISRYMEDSGFTKSGLPGRGIAGFEAYNTLYALDRFLFKVPADRAWPIVVRKGKVQIDGMSSGYRGPIWEWKDDFKACAQFGRRNEKK